MKTASTFLKTIITLVILFSVSNLQAQQDKSKRPSPPVVADKTIGDLKITINYSSPSVNGREIWGTLVPYDKIWRTGANEATTISFNQDVKVNDHHIDAGTYSLFTLPDKSGVWDVILNSATGLWGTNGYDSDKDVARFEVQTRKISDKYEKMTFSISDDGEVTFAWDYLSFYFLVEEENK
jgi:hypothetical protein